MLNPEALEHLKVLDLELQRFNMKKKLGTKLMVILVGEAYLILKRADGMDSPKPWAVGGLFVEAGFRVSAPTMFWLHPDYEDRLEPVLELECMDVYTLGSYDYIISRIGQGTEKGLHDVLSSGLPSKVDLTKLEKMYFEAMEFWLGDEEGFRERWETFVRKLRQ